MSTYSLYFKLIKKQKGRVCIGICLLALNAIITLRIPFILNQVMDTLFSIQEKGYYTFLKTFIIYLVYFCIQLFSQSVIQLLFKKVGNNNIEYVSQDVVKRVIKTIRIAPQQFDFGNALVALNSDCFQFAEVGILLVFQMVELLINLMALFYYMWTSNYIMSLIVTVLFIILAMLQKKINGQISNCIEQDRIESEKHTKIVNMVVENKDAIYRDGSFSYIEKRFGNILERLLSVRYKMEMICQINLLVNGFVVILNMTFVFVLGAYFVLNGTMSLGSLMTFNMFSSSFGGYIGQIPGFFVQKKNFDTSCRRIKKLMNMETVDENTGKIEVPSRVKLNQIFSRYMPEQEWIFADKSFEFQKGCIYGLIGKNGTGKSTLLKILAGEIAIEKGEILINEKKIDIWERKFSLDEHVSFFSPEAVLYEDTILNNLTLEKEYSKEEFKKLLAITELTDWIDSLPERLQTKVNDLKLTVSDGQKQKIILTRYLLHCREVLLLDEVEKHFDDKTKSSIMKYLQKIKENKIILIASHDERILEHCDQVINITGGQ